MYNRTIIEELLAFIHDNEGVGNKNRLQAIVAEKYNLQKRQKKDAVYFCDFFAIRFCSSKNNRDTVSNTVMSIKHIKQYDSIPLFVCVVGPDRNYIHLANASFIKRLSHSSAFFRENNLVGSINYPDIMKEYQGIPNEAGHFEELFAIHRQIGFDGNLPRLVEETAKIVPKIEPFVPTEEQRRTILEAPLRAYAFMLSTAYKQLKEELDDKALAAESDIVLINKKYSRNVKLRGNLIEFFIKSEDEQKKTDLRQIIVRDQIIRNVKVDNNLGDYYSETGDYIIEIDIKSKVATRKSAPKGYNVDKILEFLSHPASVYLLYIVSIREDDTIRTELSSIFQKQIMEKTRIQNRWAGRNSRGTAQFNGHSLEYFLEDSHVCIEIQPSVRFLEDLLSAGEEDSTKNDSKT